MRKQANDAPAGPAPTIKRSVSITRSSSWPAKASALLLMFVVVNWVIDLSCDIIEALLQWVIGVSFIDSRPLMAVFLSSRHTRADVRLAMDLRMQGKHSKAE